MKRLNLRVLRSVEYDLREIMSLCEEISLWITSSGNKSWRFPLLRSDEVDLKDILQSAPERDSYVFLLEIAYDRTHLLFHLLIKFLDSIPGMFDDLSHNLYLKCPKYVTLGGLGNIMWQRLLMFQNNLLHTLEERIKTESISESSKSTMTMESMIPSERSFVLTTITKTRSTQTNEQQLKCCESCSIGEDMVKQLCAKIELICSENSISSAIADMRKKIVTHIFEITQIKAMIFWTEAIFQDFETINNVLTISQESNKTLDEKINSMKNSFERECQILQNKIDKLVDNEGRLSKELTEATSKYESSDHIAKCLVDQVQQQKEKIVHMNKLMDEIGNEKLQLIKDVNKKIEDNDNLAKQLEIQTMIQNDMEKDRNFWKSKCHHEQDMENLILTQQNNFRKSEENFISQIAENEAKLVQLIQENSILKEIQKESVQIQHELEEIKHCKAKLECNLIATKEELEKLSIVNEDLEKELKESKYRETVLLNTKDSIGPVNFQVKGDPISDMKSQIEANILRIQMISEQNLKLESTVEKLQSIKSLYNT